MSEHATPKDSDSGRPTTHLPLRQLTRLSLYWLGLTSIFAGLTFILGGRLEFGGLLDDPGDAGDALFRITAFGALIAIVVQPTVGAISDFTVSRWGRRKPYIFIGTIFDVVFLICIALSETLLAVAVFVALLQFSSNVAQGPFQGYVPDLVPPRQVGLASAMVGLMQVFGSVTGFVIAAWAVGQDEYVLGLVALGLVELVTMVSVVWRVPKGREPMPRQGRSWLQIAASAWGTDILRERSFVWLVFSRLLILMAGGILTGLSIFYLSRSMGYDQRLASDAFIPIVAAVAVGTIVSVLPAARISDRVGRKPVIWVSCLIGIIGLVLVAMAPSVADAPVEVMQREAMGLGVTEAMLADPRYRVGLIGAVMYGLSAGTFLAVDWALITDIIPKASSGRYMGISNVATASAGVLALAIGGRLMDSVGKANGSASGPVAAMWLAAVLLGMGALLLIPVRERRWKPTSTSGTKPAT